MLFKDLNIIEPIQRALNEAGYEEPTPIQEQSIPSLLMGRDLLGCAQTGTGKTAAFAIPVLQNIELNKKKNDSRVIKALILAPTRELAIQIEENFTVYSKFMDLKNTVIFGGVSQNPQTKILREGVDILIATPGRLLDLINQGFIDLSNVEHFVLDEADRMFDMGMVRDVKKIVAKLPSVRQNLLFSATMPSDVMKLVNEILKNPVKVEVAPVSSTVDTVTQGVYFVEKKEKKSLLVHLLKDESIKSLLVFSRTKHGANNIVKILGKAGTEAQAIHGNKSQNARQLALSNFKEGTIRVLVATDIAARGIDVNGLSHVINYDLPDVPETYVHRIGRTGRAGHSGIAISFCDSEEKGNLKDIEKVIGIKIPVMESVEFENLPVSKETEVKKEINKNSSNRRQGTNKAWSKKPNDNRNNSRKASENKNWSKKTDDNKSESRRPSENRGWTKKTDNDKSGRKASENKNWSKKTNDNKSESRRPSEKRSWSKKSEDDKSGSRRPSENRSWSKKSEDDKSGSRRPSEKRSWSKKSEDNKSGFRKPSENKSWSKKSSDKKTDDSNKDSKKAVAKKENWYPERKKK